MVWPVPSGAGHTPLTRFLREPRQPAVDGYLKRLIRLLREAIRRQELMPCRRYLPWTDMAITVTACSTA